MSDTPSKTPMHPVIARIRDPLRMMTTGDELFLAKILEQTLQENATLRELADGLAKQLREIHAFAWGECPSLLNEDSGGNARLDMAIEDALEKYARYRAACPGEGMVPMSEYIKLLDLADDLAMQFWRPGSEQKRERIADRYMEIENSAPLEAREFIERKHHKAQASSPSNSPTASRESQG